MDDEKVKIQIGANIAAYRKQAGLTQAGLAEKLNYSDKAVSKWERGESVPDVLTLMVLAEQFGITVNDLLVDPEALPGNPGTLEKAMTQVSEKALRRKPNKNIILALSSTLVWFIALLAFVVLSSFEVLDPYSYLLFFYAIPANAIVLLSLRSAWHDFRWNMALISIIMWGQSSQPVCYPPRHPGFPDVETLPAGSPRSDCHFPVVPDVPPGKRAGRRKKLWINSSCEKPSGRKSVPCPRRK